MFFADTQINTTIQQSSNALKHITDTSFNTRSLVTLVVALVIAMVAGRLLATLMRRVARLLSANADKTENLATVNRLRRFETLTVLSTALVRAFLVIFALYFWWVYTHPSQQPGAVIGASALVALVLSGTLVPVLRDLAAGGVMMAEHWFGVGDHITVEPFTLQGIVERVTLRSTKIRSLSGETVWVNNQTIAAVRVTPKGIRTIALELFVSDPDKGAELVERANLRLPSGPLMVASPLAVMTTSKVAGKLWHIAAIGEVAPGREWLLEKFAVQVMQELDGAASPHILASEPIARYSDSEAEKRFARTIRNARKTKTKRGAARRKAAKAAEERNQTS